ncbi:amino acid ABC transporter substrate-binding protein [Microvirga sesbaniae]|uniref:amino acid ABC transporter substrate-binding protein n=1 Tax=Microvirga sesbaniae TaxID=681392 RepID=UPI0021C7359E|nr:amino acid ABC transporter substrate-binding protein [Microvirga sp. HBU67692]
MLRILVLLFCFYVLMPPSFAQGEIPNDSRLRAVADRKVVRIAYRRDATPFSFVRDTERGTPVGYTIDLCRLVVDGIGRQLGQTLKIEWVSVTVNTRFSAIMDDQADMECGSSTVTLRRFEEVDFSSFVFVESTAILVRRQSDIRSLSDMNGKRIAVIAGTSNERAVADRIRHLKLNAATLVAVQSRAEGIAAVESGAADGYASDRLLLVGAAKQRPAELALLPDELSVEPYAIALPRGDWAFRLAVNRALAHIYGSGAQYDVFVRWFEQIGLHPSDALSMAWTLGILAD